MQREVQLVEEQVDTLKAERARLEDKIRDLDRQLSKANAAVADGQSRINNVLDTVRDGYGREKDTLLRKMQTDSEKVCGGCSELSQADACVLTLHLCALQNLYPRLRQWRWRRWS